MLEEEAQQPFGEGRLCHDSLGPGVTDGDVGIEEVPQHILQFLIQLVACRFRPNVGTALVDSLRLRKPSLRSLCGLARKEVKAAKVSYPKDAHLGPRPGRQGFACCHKDGTHSGMSARPGLESAPL